MIANIDAEVYWTQQDVTKVGNVITIVGVFFVQFLQTNSYLVD